MRRSFLLYIFVFTALIAVFLYVTSRRMLESKNSEIAELKEEMNVLNKEIDSLVAAGGDTGVFNFSTNDEAMSYFEERGIEASEIIALVEDEVIGRNKASEDNDLVPYEGMEGDMRINRIKVLNHKWIIASFTDGTYWGELFITYYVDENKKLHLETREALLYPEN
ncbi:MAG TPA: hypothetical protein VFM60_02395 [Salinimicrobium sp.]|nr:hypothetical protein [Salinimicrobium sp.]